jgi:hypothetical protein
MTSQKVEQIQDELRKVIGPIGKFVVEKQINNMQEDKDNFPDDKIEELIERSVDIGVFDTHIHKAVKERIRSSVLFK